MSSIEKRALEWLLSDDTGLSSKTLCAHMLGLPYGGHSSAPSDADDRGRCIRLLNKIPEWWDRLDEMASNKDIEVFVISGKGMDVEMQGWSKQIPLIRAEAKELNK